jgi:hypothetical protein
LGIFSDIVEAARYLAAYELRLIRHASLRQQVTNGFDWKGVLG